MLFSVIATGQADVAVESIAVVGDYYTIRCNTALTSGNAYEIQERTTEVTVIDNTPDSMLSKFIATKRIEGKSEATVQRYRDACYLMIHSLCKPLYKSIKSLL